MKIKIALLQLTANKFDQESNKHKADKYCREAKELDADIILFPEMWNIGYESFSPSIWRQESFPDKISKDSEREIIEWQSNATDINSGFINHFKLLAKELGVAIAITYLQKGKAKPYNSVALFDRFGEIVLNYSKVHTCDFSMEYFCEPGKNFYVCDLNTKEGFVKIGCMICFDREFPESARELMLMGAEIILIPNCCEMDSHRSAQLKTRAFENMVGVALTNYPSPKCNGRSQAYSPVVCTEDTIERSGHMIDNLIVMADDKEGIFIAEFDMDDIRKYRQREVWGNAYRKVNAYKHLTSEKVSDPFIRKNT